MRLKAKGTKVFIAAGAAGMVVADVTEPYTPRVVATLGGMNAKDIELDAAGNYAFIAGGLGGLYVVDIRDPSNPSQASFWSSANIDVTEVAVIDAATDYAYVLCREPLGVTRIRVIDVTNRNSIVEQTEKYTNGAYAFTDVAATLYGATRYVFVTAGSSDGLLKLTHNPGTSLSIVGGAFIDASFWTHRVAVKPTTSGSDCLYALGQAKFDMEPPPEYEVMAIRISDMTKRGESAIRSGWVDGSSNSDLALLWDASAGVTAAYVADGIGLVSYDLSTPTSPVVGESWNIPGAPTGVATNGPYVFAAAGALGFHLVNAGMPYPPTIASDDASDTRAGIGVAVRGNTLFMTVGAPSTPGIQAYDITNPAAPVTLGFTPLAGPGDLAIAGDYAFVANGSTLKVLDIRNPALPLPEVGTANSRYGPMSSIAVSGDLAFLTGSALQCFDVADPTAPLYRGIHDSDGGGVNGVAGRGRMAYVAEGAYFQPNALKLIDLSNPEIPALKGKAVTGGMTDQSVTLEWPWAFVADSFPNMGLWAANVDPASPSYLASYGPCDVGPGAVDGWADAVFSRGGWAYVTGDSASWHGLSVLDVADPTTLGPASLKYSLSLGGSPRGLVVSGGYGYVANGSLGLQVIKVAP